MSFCSEIPAAAWQQLQGATWPKLTKVEVDQRLGFWAPVGVFVDALEMVVGVRGGGVSGAKLRGGRHPTVSQETSGLRSCLRYELQKRPKLLGTDF